MLGVASGGRDDQNGGGYGRHGRRAHRRALPPQRASLVTLARVMTGSTQTAEELVQDAFVKLQQQTGPITYPEAYLRAGRR